MSRSNKKTFASVVLLMVVGALIVSGFLVVKKIDQWLQASNQITSQTFALNKKSGQYPSITSRNNQPTDDQQVPYSKSTDAELPKATEISSPNFFNQPTHQSSSQSNETVLAQPPPLIEQNDPSITVNSQSNINQSPPADPKQNELIQSLATNPSLPQISPPIASANPSSNQENNQSLTDNSPTSGDAQKPSISVKIVLQKPNEKKQWLVEASSGSSVYDVLAIAHKQFGFSLQTKQYSFGVFIDELDGLTSDKVTGQYWTYSVNGQFASVGASSYVVKDGDTITWRYGK